LTKVTIQLKKSIDKHSQLRHVLQLSPKCNCHWNKFFALLSAYVHKRLKNLFNRYLFPNCDTSDEITENYVSIWFRIPCSLRISKFHFWARSLSFSFWRIINRRLISRQLWEMDVGCSSLNISSLAQCTISNQGFDFNFQ
jgi:hypothetical protein